MNAPSTETLIGIEITRMKRKCIKNSANVTTATWLDDLQKRRLKVKSRRATNIVRDFITGDELHVADDRFHWKIQAARRTTIQTDQQEVGKQPVDTSNE